MKKLSSLAVLVALCAALAPLAARAVQHIPYTEVNGGLIQVQGSVDGRPPVPMLVDTGAGVNVLSEKVGAPLVLVDGKYVSLRLTGERVDLPMGGVVSLTVGDFSVKPPRVGIWKGLDGTGNEGLISAMAFRDVATTIDFKNHEIVMEDAASFPERKRMDFRVPLILQDDFDTALGLFAKFDLGHGKIATCEIDTGKIGITVDRRFAKALGLDPNATEAVLPQIAVADAPEVAMKNANVKFADLIHDCNVGNSFWAGRTITLDILNRFMWVSNPA